MLFRDNPDKASNNTVNGGGGRSIQRVKTSATSEKQDSMNTTNSTVADLDLGVDTRLKAELTLGRRNDIKHKCTE